MHKTCLSQGRLNDENKYKAYRKSLKLIIQQAKEQYFQELFDIKRNSIKQLWKNLNSVSSIQHKRDSCPILKLLVNNRCITDKKDICNSFNNYFATIGCHPASNIDSNTVNNFKNLGHYIFLL